MVVGVEQQQGAAVGRRADVGKHVVHGFQLGVLLHVHFQDDFLRRFHPLVVRAYAHGWDEFAVFGNAHHFNNCHVHRTKKAKAHLLLNLRKVHIGVGDFACVDVVAQRGVGLERAAQFQAA